MTGYERVKAKLIIVCIQLSLQLAKLTHRADGKYLLVGRVCATLASEVNTGCGFRFYERSACSQRIVGQYALTSGLVLCLISAH